MCKEEEEEIRIQIWKYTCQEVARMSLCSLRKERERERASEVGGVERIRVAG